MASLTAFIPIDRRQALLQGIALPERMTGALLFADLSGYTALTEAFVRRFGPKRGVDRLTQVINQLFTTLIEAIHAHRGSVVGFGGDALSCWFADDTGLRAVACAFAIQQRMTTLDASARASGEGLALTMKTVVVGGAIRRFLVGDPQIQYLDVLAGNLMGQVGSLQGYAVQGCVVVGPTILDQLNQIGQPLAVAKVYHDDEGRVLGALVTASPTTEPLLVEPWPLAATDADDTHFAAAQVRSWLLPPIYARLRQGQAAFLADIRPVVVLFVKFMGLDYENDEAVGAKLDAFVRRLQQLITEHEGYLLKITVDDKGSYLLAAFGAPLAHEDDATQALAAALAIRTAPAHFPFMVQVQMGISQGRTLAGAFGGPQRVAYDLLGDAVNLANRLMMVAAPGQILVSEELMRQTQRHYRFAVPLFKTLKGVAATTPLYPLLEPQLVHQPPTGRHLIDRGPELAQMMQWLTAAATGAGCLLRFEGTGGIGKSHLLAVFMARARQLGFSVAAVTSEINTQNHAYAPWQQLLRPWLGLLPEPRSPQEQLAQLAVIIAERAPEKVLLLPLLAELFNLPVVENPTTAAYTPQLRQGALLALISDLLHARARLTPLLLIFEDVQWLDEASQALILAVSRGLVNHPICLVVAHRPLDPGEGRAVWLAALARLAPYRHLLLTELPPDAVDELVRARLQGHLSPLAAALLQARAQGNPFYLEEMVTALRELGKLYYEPREERWLLADSVLQTLRAANCITKDPTTNDWVLMADAPLASIDLEIPAAVHQLVLARVDRLPEECKLTLKVASVIGRTFGIDLLTRAHPAQPQPAILQQHLRLLAQNSLIHPNTTSPQPLYDFRHPMTQEVIYGDLVEQQQQLVHGAVGYAWESIDDQAIEQLAYHFQRSSARHKSLHYLALAARKAQRSYANRTALNYYNQALALEARWEWQQGRIEVLHILGQRAEERAALEALRTQADAPAFTVAYLWGEYYEAISQYEEAEAAFQQALATARAQGSFLGEMRCLAQLGFTHWRRGDTTQAQACYQQVLTFLQARPTLNDDEQHLLTQALNGLGTLYRQQGQLLQAEAIYTQALAQSRNNRNRLEEARSLSNLGGVVFLQHHYEQAIAHHEAALQLRRMMGDRAGEGVSLYNLALNYQEQGDYGRALECLLQARLIHQRIDNLWEEVNVAMNLGILYTELGDWAKARTYLQEGLAIAQEIGDREGRIYLLSNLGLVALHQGRWDEATHHLHEGLVYMQREENQPQIAFFLSYLAMVHLAAGNFAEGQQLADQALAIRQSLGLHVRTADNLATLAAIHLARQEMALAVAYAQQAQAILDECRGVGPEFPQQDYFICHQVFAAQGQQESAHQALRAAYQLVMQRAQKIGDAVLQRTFVEEVAVNRAIIACAQRELGVGSWLG